MEHVAKYPGLMRRGTRWYLRKNVPADLVEEMGRQEVWRTLGTGDHREAVRQCPAVLAELAALFEAARRRRNGGGADVSEAELRRLVGMWFAGIDGRAAEVDHGWFDEVIRERLSEDIAAFLLSLHDAAPHFDLIGLPKEQTCQQSAGRS